MVAPVGEMLEIRMLTFGISVDWYVVSFEQPTRPISLKNFGFLFFCVKFLHKNLLCQLVRLLYHEIMISFEKGDMIDLFYYGWVEIFT